MAMPFFEPSMKFRRRLYGGKFSMLFATVESAERITFIEAILSISEHVAYENNQTPNVCLQCISFRPTRTMNLYIKFVETSLWKF
jgi:hypothetical protein